MLKLFRFFCFATALVMLVSCASNVTVHHYAKNNSKVESIVLISTMLGKLQQPTFPLLDAAMLNNKTNLVAYNIMEEQKKQIDKCRDIVAEKLKASFQCEVLYGATLQNVDAFQNLKNKYDYPSALRTNKDNFPYVITASGDINPFEYKNGNVKEYMTKYNKAYREAISELCQELQVDLVAVSYSNLAVSGVQAFGNGGQIRLDTMLYFFDKTGAMVTETGTKTERVLFPGENAKDYMWPFSMFPAAVNSMITKIAPKHK
jgi:hypothetical protein